MRPLLRRALWLYGSAPSIPARLRGMVHHKGTKATKVGKHFAYVVALWCAIDAQRLLEY
jgi:hypothetical protein